MTIIFEILEFIYNSSHYRNMELLQTEDYSQYVTNPVSRRTGFCTDGDELIVIRPDYLEWMKHYLIQGILYLSGLLKREQQINDYIYQYYKENYSQLMLMILLLLLLNWV